MPERQEGGTMNEVMGILWICGACALFVKYRPRTEESWALCILTAVMGFASLTAGKGNLFFTTVQTLLMLITGLCCLVQVRREYLYRRRRQHRLRALRRGRYSRTTVRPAPWLTEPDVRGILNAKAEGRRTA